MTNYNIRYVVRPGGVAALEGCNIYENAANVFESLNLNSARSPLEHSRNHHPSSRTHMNLTCAVMCAKGAKGKGGGLNIKGLATLTNTNVYANRLAPLGEVCARRLPLLVHHLGPKYSHSS